MFLRNERSLGVKNGTLGTIERADPGSMTVRLDGGRQVQFDAKAYAAFDHGYAATFGKSQGVSVDDAHALATPGMDRHSSYVGMTRHRDRVHLHYGRDDFAIKAVSPSCYLAIGQRIWPATMVPSVVTRIMPGPLPTGARSGCRNSRVRWSTRRVVGQGSGIKGRRQVRRATSARPAKEWCGAGRPNTDASWRTYRHARNARRCGRMECTGDMRR